MTVLHVSSFATIKRFLAIGVLVVSVLLVLVFMIRKVCGTRCAPRRLCRSLGCRSPIWLSGWEVADKNAGMWGGIFHRSSSPRPSMGAAA